MTNPFCHKLVAFSIVLCSFGLMGSQCMAQEKPSVGLQSSIQVTIPGGEVVARPLPECTIPIVARITKKTPLEKSFEYTIVYYGLESGEFDLRHALRRKTGEELSAVAPILINVKSVLPPGLVEPNTIESNNLGLTSTYKSTLILAAILWVLGLLAILFSGHVSKAESAPVEEKVLTLGDRMQPLISRAIDGELDSDGQAELERILLSHWRSKLSLNDLPAGEAIAKMRQDDEAGQLLRQLEEWLHRPGDKDGVRVREILSAYVDQPLQGGKES
ncbi:MAG: hypothetical protein P1V97_08700 [Planctomycetota bacterium]|nr:hypothetical protein [Planctomycetota bacterium]